MGLRVCVLASGSSGNCLYIGNQKTHLLIDAGISAKVATERLLSVNVDPQQIDAVCVTHEHEDHKASLGVFQRRFQASLYGNAGTIEVLERSPKTAGLAWNVFVTGHSFPIGDLSVEPFRVPHDCYDPVGFVVSDGLTKVGVVTDLGMPTELVRQRLRGCSVLILETNHDEAMLRDSNRSWPLKQRIASRQGHLSNVKAAELLCDVVTPSLHSVYLAHMSQDCNRPSLAEFTVAEALRRRGIKHVSLLMTYRDRASDVVEA